MGITTILTDLAGTIGVFGAVKQTPAGAVVHGDLYEDAAAALRSWHAAGVALYIYSSSPIAIQRQLIRHSSSGDLTPLISGYFDPTVGSKLNPASYQRILTEIGAEAKNLLFFSDSIGELDAAGAAGLATIYVRRDERAPATPRHRMICGFAGFVL